MLSAGNLALARLPGGGRDMQRLLHGLIDRLGRQVEKRADACCRRRPEMGDMVDLVLVQADAFHEIDLDFVARREAANEPAPSRPQCWASPGSAGYYRPDGNIRRQKRVVKIEFAHRRAIGPCRPFGEMRRDCGGPKTVAPSAGRGCASA